MRTKHQFLIILCLILLCSEQRVLATETEAKPFRIAKISNNPRKQIKRIQPFASYLADKMAAFGYTHGEVIVVKNQRDLAKLIREQDVELISSTSATAAYLTEQQLANIIALRWKNGLPSYKSLLITRSGANINSLSDLVGKRIAFEDVSSTTSYTIPAGTMRQQGIKLEPLANSRAKTRQADSVGFIFGYSEETLAAWLAKHIVDAAAFSDIDWRATDKIPETQKSIMKVIWESAPVPRALILGPASQTIEEQNAILSILLDIHNDANAVIALSAFHNTTKFEAPNKSVRDAIDDIGKFVQLLSTDDV